MKLPILRETPHWLAINKPAGIIVEENPWETSIQKMTLEYLSKSSKKPYLGIVHRLDRVTSGVLLLAKKKSALKELNEQFRLRKVRKTYWAIVENAPPKENGALRHWLRKDQKNKKAILFPEEKKDSTKCSLSYQLLAQNSKGYLLEIYPETGRFHQIRVQLSSIGCPIIGDEKYGSSSAYLSKSVALHARKLSFKDPKANQKIVLTASPPKNSYWNTFDL